MTSDTTSAAADSTSDARQFAMERLRSLHHVIGNTPLLAIRFRFRGRERVIYAKAENQNLTGSIKDRMALSILSDAYAQGLIRPGDKIVEATSGNTGIAFAALGRALGHPVSIFMPDWMSKERMALIRSFGATIVPVSRAEGGFAGSVERAEAMAKQEAHVFLPHQYANAANPRAHEATTGPEIWRQLESIGLKPDAFVAGVGTGGTIMGTGRYLKSRRPGIRIHPLEAAESPTLRTGHKTGQHRIQGMSDEFIPGNVRLVELDDLLDVNDGDAILMAQKLAAELGLGVGISSGANLVGAIKAQNQMSGEAVVCTVFADDNKKYLSSELFKEEIAKPGFLAPEVELLSFKAIPRAGADPR
jgi:cysteine synthase A